MGYYNWIVFFVLLALFLYVTLTYMLTGYGYRFDIGWFLLSHSPFNYAVLGVAISIMFSVFGASCGIYAIGSSILGNFYILFQLIHTFLADYFIFFLNIII
jgi:hypothetical protein